MKITILNFWLMPAMLVFVAASACTGGTVGTQGSQPRTVVSVPAFSADSAYAYVAAQVAFGPRVPGSEAHRLCADYLSATLTRMGAAVTVQKADVEVFDGQTVPMYNVIGSFRPEKRNRIMLCSHWDSRPFADHDSDPARRDAPIDGANDGASGVGVLLEVARHLGTVPAQLGVDIIFFDVEDYGLPDHRDVGYKPDTWCLGSLYWGRHPHAPGYEARYGILLDMVGAADAVFCRELYSKQTAPHVVDAVWDAAARLGYGSLFVRSDGGSITDDHVYVNRLRGFPCIDIIHYEPHSSTGFCRTWHTQDDRLENISRPTLQAVGRTVMEVIYNER